MSEKNFLFVYGTLRPDTAQARHSKYPHVGLGKTPGRLFNVSTWFPGALFGGDKGQVIVGDVLEVTDQDLKALDGYEGCRYPDQKHEDNLYNRVVVQVDTENGPVECWAYEFNSVPPEEDLIASGDWLNK